MQELRDLDCGADGQPTQIYDGPDLEKGWQGQDTLPTTEKLERGPWQEELRSLLRASPSQEKEEVPQGSRVCPETPCWSPLGASSTKAPGLHL